jgi:hypothetical protein
VFPVFTPTQIEHITAIFKTEFLNSGTTWSITLGGKTPDEFNAVTRKGGESEGEGL